MPLTSLKLNSSKNEDTQLEKSTKNKDFRVLDKSYHNFSLRSKGDNSLRRIQRSPVEISSSEYFTPRLVLSTTKKRTNLDYELSKSSTIISPKVFGNNRSNKVSQFQTFLNKITIGKPKKVN